MINKIMFTLIAICLLLGCGKQSPDDKTVIFGRLSFKTFDGEKVFDAEGIDSDVRKIVLNGGDTLTIELGNHVFNLKEDFITVMSPQDKQEWEVLSKKPMKKENLVVSENAEEETRYGLFLKNYYMYDTLSGIPVEIVNPKKIGNGITGVYISKLKDGFSFSMYGINLNPSSQKEAVEIIRSLNNIE